MWGLGLGGSSKQATWFLRGSAWLVKHSDHFVRLKSGSTYSSGEVEGLGGNERFDCSGWVGGVGVSVCVVLLRVKLVLFAWTYPLL